jgi:HlyD family secretion protein
MAKHPFYRFLKNKWVIIGLIIIIIIGAISYMMTRTKAATFQYAVVSMGNVVEKVSVTGTVSPVDKADLAFEKSGVISKIYVKVGDQIKAGDPIATLDNAQDTAVMASAQATLADMSRPLTTEESAVQNANVDAAKVSLDNAGKDAVNAFHDSYVKAQGAVVNYADTFFSNPQSANPTLNVRTDSSARQTSINTQRVLVSDTLDSWFNALSVASVSTSSLDKDASNYLSDAHGYLISIKGFMADLSSMVNDLSTGNSGLPQPMIDADVAAMNTGTAALNSAVDAITSAQAELSAAQSSYDQAVSNRDLKLSGNSSQSIAAQAAKVAQAQAALNEDTIVSPIDGIVTQADPNLGEFAAAGQSGFSVQNSGFKIEAYVPEADIAKVAVGDLASSTLDAYGSYVDFPAHVVSIDPAETVLEGVPTYKVILQFVSPDARIRSGMTANLDILTHEASSVTEIPYRAIAITATSTTVRLVSSDGKSYVAIPVVTGLKGSDGTIEITSGLKEGDKVVTYVTGQ